MDDSVRVDADVGESSQTDSIQQKVKLAGETDTRPVQTTVLAGERATTGPVQQCVEARGAVHVALGTRGQAVVGEVAQFVGWEKQPPPDPPAQEEEEEPQQAPQEEAQTPRRSWLRFLSPW